MYLGWYVIPNLARYPVMLHFLHFTMIKGDSVEHFKFKKVKSKQILYNIK